MTGAQCRRRDLSSQNGLLLFLQPCLTLLSTRTTATITFCRTSARRRLVAPNTSRILCRPGDRRPRPPAHSRRSFVLCANDERRNGPGPSDSITDDDARLHEELQRKVRELYGGRENIAIVTDDATDTVEFRVRRGPSGVDYTTYRSALYTVAGLVLSALISVSMFMFLIGIGAVHDAAGTEHRHLMPSYGTRTYIDPYELLEEDTPIIKQ